MAENNAFTTPRTPHSRPFASRSKSFEPSPAFSDYYSGDESVLTSPSRPSFVSSLSAHCEQPDYGSDYDSPSTPQRSRHTDDHDAVFATPLQKPLLHRLSTIRRQIIHRDVDDHAKVVLDAKLGDLESLLDAPDVQSRAEPDTMESSISLEEDAEVRIRAKRTNSRDVLVQQIESDVSPDTVSQLLASIEELTSALAQTRTVNEVVMDDVQDHVREKMKLQAENFELQQEAQTAKDELRELSTHLEALKLQVSKREEQGDLDQEIENLRGNHAQLQTEIEGLRLNADMLRKQLSDCELQVDSLQTDLSDARNQKFALQSQQTDLEKHVAYCEVENVRLQSELIAAQSNVQTAKKECDLQKSQIVSQQTELDKVNDDVSKLYESIQAFESEQTVLKSQALHDKAEIQHLHDELAQAQQSKHILNTEKAAVQIQLSGLEKENAEIHFNLDQANQNTIELMSELESLREMTEQQNDDIIALRHDSQNEVEQSQLKVQDIMSSLDHLQATVASREAEAETLRNELQKAYQSVDLTIADYKVETEELRNDLRRAQRTIVNLQDELDDQKRELMLLKNEHEFTRLAAQKQFNDCRGLAKANDALQCKLEWREDHITTLQSELHLTSENLTITRSDLDVAEDKVHRRDIELKDLERSLEGVHTYVSRLLAELEALKSKANVVEDLAPASLATQDPVKDNGPLIPVRHTMTPWQELWRHIGHLAGARGHD